SERLPVQSCRLSDELISVGGACRILHHGHSSAPGGIEVSRFRSGCSSPTADTNFWVINARSSGNLHEPRADGGRADQPRREGLRHLFPAAEGAHHFRDRRGRRQYVDAGRRAAFVSGGGESEEG